MNKKETRRNMKQKNRKLRKKRITHKGGSGRNTMVPQGLVNMYRSLFSNINISANELTGKTQNPSLIVDPTKGHYEQ
jgi:hypothetical protein